MKLFTFLVCITFISSSWAQSKCAAFFAKSSIALEQTLISPSVYKATIKKLSSLQPEIQEFFKEETVSQLLMDDTAPLLRENLLNLFKEINSKTTKKQLLSQLSEHLHNKVPARQIDERIQNLLERGDLQSLRRVFGEKTLEETQELIYGTDPAKPSPESLMGQYLAESGALFSERSYKAAHGSRDRQTKSSVGISPSQNTLFYKYFVGVPELLFHYHTPQQGTLQILFDKKMISYAGGNQDPLFDSLTTSESYSIETGTILPMVILSTSEAQRLVNYFALGRINQNFAKEPWDKLPNYCAKGGYSSCTHWFGEMPVGDKQVKSYVYPGRVDAHADNYVGKGPQSKILKPYFESEDYQRILQQSNLSYAQWSERLLQLWKVAPQNASQQQQNLDKLARLVWTVPGAQHFADMLGLREPKLQGEFANPGYVAYNLIGRTTRKRVPYVFHTVGEKTQKIPQPLRIHAY